jgi:uncharacterized protein (DUF488 family)
MIYTVGHSTLPQDEFVTLLAGAFVSGLWDVRSYPSSHWDWFRRERLETWLPQAGVEYRWVPALGGRRGAVGADGTRTTRSTAQERLPLAWQQEGFVNYQWHMTTEQFFASADALAKLGAREDIAVMCAEGLWWRCHRSMIADYLVFAGSEVVHLQPKATRHVLGDRLGRYDPEVPAAWHRHLGACDAASDAAALAALRLNDSLPEPG